MMRASVSSTLPTTPPLRPMLLLPPLAPPDLHPQEHVTRKPSGPFKNNKASRDGGVRGRGGGRGRGGFGPTKNKEGYTYLVVLLQRGRLFLDIGYKKSVTQENRRGTKSRKSFSSCGKRSGGWRNEWDGANGVKEVAALGVPKFASV